MLSYVEFWIGTSCDPPLGNGSRVVLSASSRKAAEDFRAAPPVSGGTTSLPQRTEAAVGAVMFRSYCNRTNSCWAPVRNAS